jgi:hypothetical protein
VYISHVCAIFIAFVACDIGFIACVTCDIAFVASVTCDKCDIAFVTYIIYIYYLLNAAVVGDGAVKLGVGSLVSGSLVDKAVVSGAFACGVDIVSVGTALLD